MRLSFAIAGLRARFPTCALAWVSLLLASACSTPPSAPPPPPAPAVLQIENLGPCAWRITAVSAENPADPQELTVAIDGTARLELPAGTYEVTQEALAQLIAEEAVRRFEITLEAGETYRWRLVTLATVTRGFGP